MSVHRYLLTPYKGPATRHICPACGKRHKFSRYIDTTTDSELADHCGRCDREDCCGYHYGPKQLFADNPNLIIPPTTLIAPKKEAINRSIDYLPFELMEKSVSRHRECNLYPFLAKLFRADIADQLCNNYFIGANKEGNTCFWQVDADGNTRQCKIIHYLPDGHRNKETGAIFAGKKILNNAEADLRQCFFGEYLLSFSFNDNKPIAICESEKTAIIASVYYPDFVWLATGGKNGVKMTEKNVCKVLIGRKVILFPDLGAHDSWKSKGSLMGAIAGCKIVLSNVLEKNATAQEKLDGLDIIDYLLRVEDKTGLALTDHNYPVIFDYDYPKLLQAIANKC